MTLLEVAAMAMLLPSVARNAGWRARMPRGLASLGTIPLGAWVLVWLDTESLQQVAERRHAEKAAASANSGLPVDARMNSFFQNEAGRASYHFKVKSRSACCFLPL